tara:strand:+ start:83083 stop:84231 length:1149 start_codon:yes stop_codon:yes gene_type:complete
MLQLFKKKTKEVLPARERGNSCLNCNTLLNGEENFCPECGQRNNIKQLSFRLFLDEFFGDLFTYDSRVWRTVIPLILKPGKVAYEFISGKRKVYVNPFRTYLTVSLIFFITLGFKNSIDRLNSDGTINKKSSIINFGTNNGKELTSKERDSILDLALGNTKKEIPISVDSTLKANNIDLDSLKNKQAINDSIKNEGFDGNGFFNKMKTYFTYYKNNKEVSTVQALDSLGHENTFWNRFYYTKAKNSYDMMKDEGGFNDKLFSSLSIAIFLFLPIFALFLKLIYVRRKYSYMEHMVFVFYTQTVFFLLMLLFLGISYFSENNSELMITIFMILFAVYLLLAMKSFYKQGWIKTIIKFFLTNFSFLIMAAFGFSILTLVVFLIY